MTLYYEAGFAVSSTTGSPLKMTCTVAGFAATVGTGTYAMQTMAACPSAQASGYTSFTAAVKAALDAAGGGPYTVTYSTSTHKITISRATNFTFVLSGATASDVLLAHALGFSTGSLSGATTYTGTLTPYYVLVPAIQARTAQLPFVYEPDDIVAEGVTDSGTTYAVAKDTTELYADWIQSMEPTTAVYDTAALAAVPWTWQKFYRHVRGQYPFAVYESSLFNAAYKMRAESARFKATPVWADSDTLYNLALKTRYLGTV